MKFALKVCTSSYRWLQAAGTVTTLLARMNVEWWQRGNQQPAAPLTL